MQVVQELVLARSALFMWGVHELQWISIERTFRHLQRMVLATLPSGFYPGRFAPMNRVIAFRNPLAVKLDFIELLTFARHLSCSDDRDRIYGLIGLWEHHDAVRNASSIGTVIPDYTKSAEHIYWDFAVGMVESGLGKRLFGCIKHQHHLEPWRVGQMPSWVPRWNVDDKVELPNSMLLVHALQEHLKIQAEYSLHTSTILKGTQASLPTSVEKKDTMQVLGAKLDSVVAISDVLCTETSIRVLHSTVAFWYDHIKAMQSQHEGRDLCRDLCQTIVCGFPTGSDCGLVARYIQWTLDADVGETAPTLVTRILSFLHLLQNRFEQGSQLTKADPSLRDSEQLIWIFRETLPRALRCKRLFLTKEGHIGLCPAACHPGDHIVVLPGVGAPMAVRQQDAFYQVVGPTYMAIFDGAFAMDVLDNVTIDMMDFR